MESILFTIEIFAQKWWPFMIASSVQLGLFFIVIMGLSLLFKKQSARFLYGIWLIGLLKIFIPPAIRLPSFLFDSKFIPANSIPMLFVPEIQVGATSTTTLTYQGYLFLLWISIVALLLACWIYKLLWFRSNIIQSCHEITDRMPLDREMSGIGRVRFLTGPSITMPFTKGCFAPKIYVPQSILSWPQSELRALILHELAHIRRKDLLVIGLQNVIQLLYFFHPLVWLANIQISRYREKACDDFAIHAMQGKYVDYGKLLLKSLDPAVGWKLMPGMTTYFHQSKKFLINRFEYILNRKEFVMTNLSHFQKIVIAGLMILAIAFSCQKQATKGTLVTKETPIQSLPESQPKLPDSIQVRYDVAPTPIGGFQAIQAKLIYPEYARKSGVDGVVIVHAKIDTAGYVIDTKILQSLGKGGCDEAAITAINSVKWTPAKVNGKPVTVWVAIPIRFKIRGEISEKKELPDSLKLKPPENAAQFFVPYDKPPQPIGGFEAIQQNLVYPEIARRAGIEGIVIVYAQIGVNGEVIDTRILQSLGENNGCDEAAVAAIKAVKWQPAKSKGQPVSVWVSIPVRFKLQGDQPNQQRAAIPSGHADEIEKIKAQSLPYTPPEISADRAGEFFVRYDKPPEPIGGFKAIQKNLVYPELARKAGIEGQVTIFVHISENGEVIDTKILVPLGESGCNEAAIAAIKSVRWQPAQAGGKPVAVWVSVPVKFKLD